MSDDDLRGYAEPQDTGLPDQIERDPAALNSAEDLDEDRLRVDPLEKGVEPPEHWTEADKYGTTPWEQQQGEPHEMKLAAEQPDVQPGSGEELPAAERPTRRTEPDDLPEAARRGQSADEGGSVADAIRTPPPAT